MADVSLNELGPVDYVVVEFPAGASNFTGEMADELLALVDAGTIRVIDVLILTKNDDGSVDVDGALRRRRPRPARSRSRPSWPSSSPRTTSSTSRRRWTRAASPAC